MEDLRRYTTVIGADALIDSWQRVGDALVTIDAGLACGESGLSDADREMLTAFNRANKYGSARD